MEKQTRQKHRKLLDFEAICRRQGVPLTVQRRVILEALAGRSDHPTADQIFAEVGSRLPGLSRTTVYRVLETLVRLGVARKVSHPGAAVRFDPMTHRHHHLVCLGCDRLVDLEDPDLDALRLPDTRARGFQVLDYSVHLHGLCSSCRRAPGAADPSARAAPGRAAAGRARITAPRPGRGSSRRRKTDT